MNVLIACEYSGVVRDAFTRAGHLAYSCDILPTESEGNHYQENIRDVLYKDWDLLIAHPPCTYLCNSGVSWLDKDLTRWGKMFDGAEFFKLFLNCDHIPKVCIENPIMHKYAREAIGNVKYNQIIQPWMFGHTEQKATCLWLKGLPPLVPTNNVKEDMMKLSNKDRQRLHYLPPSKDRAKIRSRTYQGIADAMANQWG
jgi:hypothetical protein